MTNDERIRQALLETMDEHFADSGEEHRFSRGYSRRKKEILDSIEYTDTVSADDFLTVKSKSGALRRRIMTSCAAAACVCVVTGAVVAVIYSQNTASMSPPPPDVQSEQSSDDKQSEQSSDEEIENVEPMFPAKLSEEVVPYDEGGSQTYSAVIDEEIVGGYCFTFVGEVGNFDPCWYTLKRGDIYVRRMGDDVHDTQNIGPVCSEGGQAGEIIPKDENFDALCGYVLTQNGKTYPVCAATVGCHLDISPTLTRFFTVIDGEPFFFWEGEAAMALNFDPSNMTAKDNTLIDEKYGRKFVFDFENRKCEEEWYITD
ncbi:MAG: hypothetical protein J1E39_08130 [Eubacterium sp.]|nr:hypothetical protein [Eubacterium sp.]